MHPGYILCIVVLCTVIVSVLLGTVREKYMQQQQQSIFRDSLQEHEKNVLMGSASRDVIVATDLYAKNITVKNGDNSVTHYGPNAAWQGRLAVGASQNRTEPKTAQVISTDGNLHLDPSDGRHVHLNYYKGGNVYVGRSDRPSNLNVYGNTNVGGKLFFKDERMAHWPDGPNNSDPYFLEKVIGGGNQSSLRLTINDDDDESFQIWGGSCAAGNCGGTGAMKHMFKADGSAEHTGNMVVGRHIDAQQPWSYGSKTLFAGWGGDKVVLGNNRTGKHDTAFHAPPNTVVSTNNMLVAGNQTIVDGDNSVTHYGPNAAWSGRLAVGASQDRTEQQTAQVISTDGNLHLDPAAQKSTYINFYKNRPVFIGPHHDNIHQWNTNARLGVNGNIKTTTKFCINDTCINENHLQQLKNIVNATD